MNECAGILNGKEINLQRLHYSPNVSYLISLLHIIADIIDHNGGKKGGFQSLCSVTLGSKD